MCLAQFGQSAKVFFWDKTQNYFVVPWYEISNGIWKSSTEPVTSHQLQNEEITFYACDETIYRLNFSFTH